MKSDVINVSSKADQIEKVLSQAERVAVYQQLSPKAALRLRLLAEEMMSLVRAISGEVEGKFWIENKGSEYELHLLANIKTYYEEREKLLSVASSGKNEAHRGFLGKIRAFFEPIGEVPEFFDLSADELGAVSVWSMRAYETTLRQYVQEERSGAAEAWDELEKSVLAHLADEVKVGIREDTVEMTVLKNLV